MKKAVLFAFNGDSMCFIHVLLNALEFDKTGYETLLVIEGSATKLVEALSYETSPLHELYSHVKERGLIAGVCEACASKMGVIDSVKSQELTLLNDMSGHPSVVSFIERGFEVYTF